MKPVLTEPVTSTQANEQAQEVIVRRNADDSIDEIVAHNCTIHLEQMDNNSFFLGIDGADGSYWQFWLGAKNYKSHVAVRHTEHSTPDEEAKRRASSLPSRTGGAPASLSADSPSLNPAPSLGGDAIREALENDCLTIEVALGDCDGAELIDGSVIDIPEAYESLERIRAALQPAPVERDGWKLVPVEPTEAMIEAHFAAHAKAKTVFADVPEIWKAMLVAAPLERSGDALAGRFRKKPVEVEAYQLTEAMVQAAVLDGQLPLGLKVGSANFHREHREIHRASLFCVTIHKQKTPVAVGDWIITEPDGIHHYPCKPDVFAATYEPASRSPHALDARTIEACARALLKKLSEVEEATFGYFAEMSMRGRPYKGPNWEKEVEDLTRALASPTTGEDAA